jgi:putative hydrolase of the HAD superfamily
MLLLLDFDGVLNEAMVFARWLEAEWHVPPERTASFFRGPFVECMEGRAELWRELPPYLEMWRWPGSTGEFIEAWMQLDDNPNGELLAAVQTFRRAHPEVEVGLGTNQEAVRAERVRAHRALAGVVDTHFISCDLGVTKPSAGFYEAVEALSGRSGGEVLFLDDDEEHVEAALARGWRGRRFEGIEDFHTAIDGWVALGGGASVAGGRAAPAGNAPEGHVAAVRRSGSA